MLENIFLYFFYVHAATNKILLYISTNSNLQVITTITKMRFIDFVICEYWITLKINLHNFGSFYVIPVNIYFTYKFGVLFHLNKQMHWIMRILLVQNTFCFIHDCKLSRQTRPSLSNRSKLMMISRALCCDFSICSCSSSEKVYQAISYMQYLLWKKKIQKLWQLFSKYCIKDT